MKRILLIFIAVALVLLIAFIKIFSKQPKNNPPTLINNNQKTMPAQSQIKIIRNPAVAGQFYPADKNELSQMIDEFLSAANPPAIVGQPQILIVPHAGYVFSAGTAAYAFKTLKNFLYDTVIILGSSHNYPVDGLALYNGDAVATPLGEAETNKKMIDNLVANNKNIFIDNNVHAPEHSLEVEIPFLQKVLNNNFKLVLGLINSDDSEILQSIADTLVTQITPRTLIIISSDLSHYPNYSDAIYSDTKIIDSVLTKDIMNFDNVFNSILAENLPWLDTCACGSSAIKIGMLLAEKLGLTGVKLHYSNSGDTQDHGDKSRVVGYGAIVFMDNESRIMNNRYLNDEEQKAALALARNALELEFGLTKEKNEDYKKYPVFSDKRGVFVTLKKNNELRGCIGLIEPVTELSEVIKEMALSAAFNDSRFSPVEKDELKNIDIEISVLTPPQKISNPEKEIILGRHGVIIKQGSHSGVFLPQVATETGWDLETFMAELCTQKAGLSSDCWKNGSVDIYTFEAQVFEEK